MLQNKSKSSWRSLVLLIAAVLIVMTVATACGKKSETSTEGGTKEPTTQTGGEKPADNGNVIATYKGGTVTEAEFNKYATFFGFMNQQYAMMLSIPQYKEQFLKEYVGYKILFADIDDSIKKEADKDADEFEKQFSEAIEKQPQMKEAMDKAGLTLEETKGFYHLVVSVMKDAESKVKEEAIKAEFDKDPEGFTLVEVRHVLVGLSKDDGSERSKEDALKLANEAKDKLKGGATWDEIAKEYSDDPGSKDTGGFYASKEVKSYVTAFREASLKQPLNEIGEPVETEFGYHVIQVEKRQSQTYETMVESTKTSLRQQLASTIISDFMSNELPGLLESVNLPQEQPATEAPSSGTEGTKEEAPATDDGAAKTQ